MEIKSDVLTISIIIEGRQRLRNLVLRIIMTVIKQYTCNAAKVTAPNERGNRGESKIQLIFREIKSPNTFLNIVSILV